ncbi:MAG TPA: hypothetical protein VFZ21_11520 [Gemmatimonadaceae bacterium]|jgi:hypothetical protein|nr:hypothetical protein [Gemmatimonadaceae bacterium]
MGWFSDAVGIAKELLSTETRTIRGVRVSVYNTRADIETHRVFERLDGALGVIERYQPHRLRRFRRDVAGIVVKRFPCRAAFFGDTRVCLIELTFAGAGQFSDAQVAASIVHEGVHARLLTMGLSGHPGCEAREERLCRKAELELGLAVPDGQAVVERALASLTLEDAEVAPNVDWRIAQQRVADADAAAAHERRDPGV